MKDDVAKALLRAIRYVDYVAGGDVERDTPADVVDEGLRALLRSGVSVDDICDDTQFDQTPIAALAEEVRAPTRRYHWVCGTCGSKNVNCSGTLQWDFDAQEWIFDGVPLDDDFCEDCDGETRLVQEFEHTCPHCGRDLEGGERQTGVCTSDDCPRHDDVTATSVTDSEQ